MTQAQAMSEAKRLKSIMNKWGVKCSIELQGGRGSDPWAVPRKYHRMHHHTVSTYRPGGSRTPVLALCKSGRSDVPGPLCNGYGGYDLIYRIICMGLANHPGAGGPITIDGVRIPQDSARGPTWGTEWEGGLQDWAIIPGMLEFMGRADNALAEWSDRPLTSQMEHKTWAPTRKIDRKDFDAGRVRGIQLTNKWHSAVGDDEVGPSDWTDKDVARVRRIISQEVNPIVATNLKTYLSKERLHTILDEAFVEDRGEEDIRSAIRYLLTRANNETLVPVLKEIRDKLGINPPPVS